MKLKRKNSIIKRVKNLQKIFKLDMQKIRSDLLTNLHELFHLAYAHANNRALDDNIREKWMRVAGYIAQTIETVIRGYHETEIDENLKVLERLVDEAKAAEEAQAASSEIREATKG